MKCLLCERVTVSGLCQYHQTAKERVEAAYPLWVEAHGTIKWKDYLDRVIYSDQTGQWAKEIAEWLERG